MTERPPLDADYSANDGVTSDIRVSRTEALECIDLSTTNVSGDHIEHAFEGLGLANTELHPTCVSFVTVSDDVRQGNRMPAVVQESIEVFVMPGLAVGVSEDVTPVKRLPNVVMTAMGCPRCPVPDTS